MVKAMSPPASLPFIGQVTEQTILKWSIHQICWPVINGSFFIHKQRVFTDLVTLITVLYRFIPFSLELKIFGYP